MTTSRVNRVEHDGAVIRARHDAIVSEALFNASRR